MGLGFRGLTHEQVLVKSPNHFDALHLLGVIAAQTKNFKLAEELIEKAILIDSSNAVAHFNRGVALNELSRYEEALSCYDKAIEIKSDYLSAYSNRGAVLEALNRFEEAVASYNLAIEINPSYAQAYSNRSVALRKLKRFEEALVSYDKAIEIRPDYADSYYNRGNLLQELKRIAEALASYDKAIEIKPDHPHAQWNKSLALLISGEFEIGWKLFEWRWVNHDQQMHKRTFTKPLWLGAEDVATKTILLHAEQGLGDTIQFCRYAPLVKSKGARVLMEVPQTLFGLLNNLEGVDEMVIAGKPLPSFDFHCPLMSLPLAFKTELATIPFAKPYLVAKVDKCEYWSKKLGKKSQKRIGLVWSGSTTHINDHNRSMTLKEMLSHLPQGYEYVSLQKEVRAIDEDLLIASGIHHYGLDLNDFTDTAALCELMDVVISVDTSVAHLAAAMGKKTWILLPYAPDWRWLLDRSDSPWYETVRLYRKSEIRTWDTVLKRVAVDLKEL